jgi:hypothetical protein
MAGKGNSSHRKVEFRVKCSIDGQMEVLLKISGLLNIERQKIGGPIPAGAG